MDTALSFLNCSNKILRCIGINKDLNIYLFNFSNPNKIVTFQANNIFQNEAPFNVNFDAINGCLFINQEKADSFVQFCKSGDNFSQHTYFVQEQIQNNFLFNDLTQQVIFFNDENKLCIFNLYDEFKDIKKVEVFEADNEIEKNLLLYKEKNLLFVCKQQVIHVISLGLQPDIKFRFSIKSKLKTWYVDYKRQVLVVIGVDYLELFNLQDMPLERETSNLPDAINHYGFSVNLFNILLDIKQKILFLYDLTNNNTTKKTIEFQHFFDGSTEYLSHAIFSGVTYNMEDKKLFFYMLMNNIIFKVGYLNKEFSFYNVIKDYTFYSERVAYNQTSNIIIFFDFNKQGIFMIDTKIDQITKLIELNKDTFVRFIHINQFQTQLYFVDTMNQIRIWDIQNQKDIPYRYGINCLKKQLDNSQSLFYQQELIHHSQIILNQKFPDQLLIWTWVSSDQKISWLSIIHLNDTFQTESVHVIFEGKIIEKVYWQIYGTNSNYTYVLFQNDFNIRVYDLSKGDDSEKIPNEIEIAQLVKPCMNNAWIEFTDYYVVVGCSASLNFYLRTNHQFITSYYSFLDQMRIQMVKVQVDHFFFIVLNGEIQLIEIDYMNKLEQIRLLWQLATSYHKIVYLDLFYLVFTIDIQITIMKYGEIQQLEFYVDLQQYSQNKNQISSKNGLCSYSYIKEKDPLQNIQQSYLMQIGSQFYMQKIESLLIIYERDSIFRLPYIPESLRIIGYQLRIINRIRKNTPTLTIPRSYVNFNSTSVIEFKNIIISLKEIKHIQFYLSSIQLNNSLIKVNFDRIKLAEENIINSSFNIQNIQQFSIKQFTISNITNITSPNSLFLLSNILYVFIDTLIIKNISLLAKTPILDIQFCQQVSIKNIIIENLQISQDDEDFNNILQSDDGEILDESDNNEVFYQNNISYLAPNSTNLFLFSFAYCQNVTIQNISISSNSWKNGTNLFNLQYISYLQISNVTIEDNQFYNFNYQNFQSTDNVNLLGDSFNNQRNMQSNTSLPYEELTDQYESDKYQDIDLTLEYLKGFISISNSNYIQISDISIQSVKLDTKQFSFMQFIQCQKVAIQKLEIYRVQQITPYPAIALKIQGISELEVSQFTFQSNFNLQIATIQKLNVNSAQTLINKFIKLKDFQFKNSNCNLSFIEIEAFKVVIEKGIVFNLENKQSEQDILKLREQESSILYQRIPTGVISIFDFNTLNVDQTNFILCKAYFSSTLYLVKGQFFSLTSSRFEANEAKDRAGGFILNNIISAVIFDTTFVSNKSIASYGGAILIYKSIVNFIRNCTFSQNTALADSGGAIIIIQSEFKELKDNQFLNNKAAIGAAIRIIQCLPSFITSKKEYLYENTFSKNQASLYGNDLTYHPQGLAIVDPHRPDKLIYDNFILKDQQSGSNIFPLLKVVLIDEDFNAIKFPAYLNPKNNSSNVLFKENINVLSQYSYYQLSVQSKNYNDLQLEGNNISNFDYDQNAYVFNFTALSKPLTESIIVVQTKIPFIVIDYSSDQPKLVEAPLTFEIAITFRNCIRGEIPTLHNSNYISCDQCPSGKYSITEIKSELFESSALPQKYSCKICPQQALYCQADIIQVKNGYWRWGNYSDSIFECTRYPQNCIPEDPDNKFGCKQGMVGVLCSECDLRGEIWGRRFGKFNTDECQDCIKAKNWQNILILVIEVLLIALYQAYQINKQRIFALKQCAYKCLRTTKLVLMGKSELIDQGSIYLKMYVNYAQLMVAFKSFHLNFLPDFLSSLFSIMGGDSFSLSFFNIDCFISSSIPDLPIYINKLIYTQIYPLFFVATNIFFRILFKTPKGLAMTQKLPNYLKENKRPSLIERQREQQTLKRIKNFIFSQMPDIKSSLIFLYFFYAPSIIKTILSYIVCTTVDGKSIIVGDQTQFCHQNYHLYYLLIIIAPLFVVWIFLIPISLLSIIHLNKKHLNWFYMKRSYGYIYQEYRPSIYYWEFLKVYVKILIISSQIIFHNSMQLQQLLILLCLLLYLLITIKVKPYSSDDMNSCDKNFTIILIFNILLFSIIEQIKRLLFIKYLIQVILLIINLCIILFISKCVFLTKFPFSYLKMNFFQKVIFIICARFPRLYKYIEFQPQDPFRVFRNWQKLRIIVSKFCKLKKEYSFQNEQLYKLYMTTQVNIGTNISQHDLSSMNKYVSLQTKKIKSNNITATGSTELGKNKTYQQIRFQDDKSIVGQIQFFEIESAEKINNSFNNSQQEVISSKIASSELISQGKLFSIKQQQPGSTELILQKQKSFKDSPIRTKRKSIFSKQQNL